MNSGRVISLNQRDTRFEDVFREAEFDERGNFVDQFDDERFIRFLSSKFRTYGFSLRVAKLLKQLLLEVFPKRRLMSLEKQVFFEELNKEKIQHIQEFFKKIEDFDVEITIPFLFQAYAALMEENHEKPEESLFECLRDFNDSSMSNLVLVMYVCFGILGNIPIPSHLQNMRT